MNPTEHIDAICLAIWRDTSLTRAQAKALMVMMRAAWTAVTL